MAFSTGTIVEINSGGSDTANGGGFDPAATFAADLAATLATGTAPVVTSASYTFVAGDVGHFLFVKSGTNWNPGWYPIASVSAGAATLTATAGSVMLYNNVLPKNIAAGCANTVSPTSGTWGIDYSRKTSAAITYTDMVIDGTTNTKYTSALNPVGVNVVGNIIVVTSGTGFTAQRVVVSSVSGTTATCDKSLGTLSSTGGHGGLGGAMASPGGAFSWCNGIANLFAYIVGGSTFTMVNSSNVAGGKVAIGNGLQSIIGYTTNRHPFNTDSGRPIIQSNANSFSLIFVSSGSGTNVHCIDFRNGNSNTSIRGFDDVNQWNIDTIWNCNFQNLTYGCLVGSQSQVLYSSFDTFSTQAILSLRSQTIIAYCTIKADTTGINGAQSVVGCTFYGGTGGITVLTNVDHVDRCVFHSHTGNNAVMVDATCRLVTNCIFVGATGTGAKAIAGFSSNPAPGVINCAFYNNTSDMSAPATFPGGRNLLKIVLTGDPCTAASSGNFSLNNTAGAGALLRATGFPTTFANGLTASALDVGPAQHADPAAGGAIPVSGSICT